MEPNGLNGGMFSTMSSGLLGVENPLQQQQQQNLTNSQHLHHLQMGPYASHHDTDTIHHRHHHHHHHHQHHQQSMKHGFPPYSAKNKQQQSTTLSDDDGPGVTADDNSPGDPKWKVSPWQRMKWTDTMVRLLIMAVYYIGDEAGSEGTDPSGKKKSTGLLQKKGKWKSVSRAMMEKGFYVSPQQCEDKFNDLNKRYKRVNDILGKGTACRVVENPNLLDTMDLPPKMKEEVRKLLNSKHLFFREMCAYHNSCGHGGSDNVPQQQVEAGIEVSQAAQQQQQLQQQQQRGCFHSSENGVVNLGGRGPEGMRMLKVGNGEGNYDDDDDDHDEDDDDDEESEEYSDEDENESGGGGSRGHGHEDEDENDGRSLRKRPRKASGPGSSMSSKLTQQLSSEVTNVFQDGGRSPWEKKQWMRSRILQLEEQQISYHSEAFELEKQRLKWARFSSKKEREMERAKLENERRRLENERMVLLISQKELEFLKLQNQQKQQQQHSAT